MLILLLIQSSMLYFYLQIIRSKAVKMKCTKSQKNITIITDRKIQSEWAGSRGQSFSKGFQTCKNQTLSVAQNQNQPMSCKHLTEQPELNEHRSRSISAQKHRRQRSTSLQSYEGSVSGQQHRKKQLDQLCFQRLLNTIKKYLFERHQNWNLDSLSYGQLLKLLWLCRFVPYAHEHEFIQNSQQTELKKVYLLWISLAQKKYVHLKDFLSFTQILQNINVDQQKADSLVSILQNELKISSFQRQQDSDQDPNFTFFTKRIEFKRNHHQLVIFDQIARDKILWEFKSFKLNKLKISGLFECVKNEETQSFVSKKSCDLAEKKRRKIEDKIRQKKPHVQHINLIDLLSFRERDHTYSKKIQVPTKKKSSISLRKGELKKELQLLSKPKPHFEERRQDEIEFEREQEQYTFHPKIHQYKTDSQEKIKQIKNIEKVLIRMRQARRQKEQKECIMQKGWCNINRNQTKQIKQVKLFTKSKGSPFMVGGSDKENINHQKQDRIRNGGSPQKKEEKLTKYEVSKDYLRIPILYIDVNIEEGKKERIVIYENDRAQTLANEFGEKHKLSEETVRRLELLLQQQMDTVLARIDEQTDDDCSILF